MSLGILDAKNQPLNGYSAHSGTLDVNRIYFLCNSLSVEINGKQKNEVSSCINASPLEFLASVPGFLVKMAGTGLLALPDILRWSCEVVLGLFACWVLLCFLVRNVGCVSSGISCCSSWIFGLAGVWLLKVLPGFGLISFGCIVYGYGFFALLSSIFGSFQIAPQEGCFLLLSFPLHLGTCPMG